MGSELDRIAKLQFSGSRTRMSQRGCYCFPSFLIVLTDVLHSPKVRHVQEAHGEARKEWEAVCGPST